MTKTKNKKTCCGSNKSSIKQGIVYGLIPHVGCIAFIIGSILGVTVLMNLFRPLLMNRYFFHGLFFIALLFATISSIFYLKKNELFSIAGIKQKKMYLFTMYASTIGINLVLFMVIFPLLANVSLAENILFEGNKEDLSEFKMSVDLPCPGHAPLIINEVKTIQGVINVKYIFPDYFDVEFDKTQTSLDEILGLDVFKEFPAEIKWRFEQ